MGQMTEVSGFFSSPSDIAEGTMGAPELIFESPTGCSCIWKVNIDGQFRALKALKREYRGDPVYEAMLRKEFEIGHALSHPNVCGYVSFASFPATGNCIIMEWIDGRTLEDVLPDIQADKQLRRKIISEICDALRYIHSKQVIHRDLKPENILVTRNGSNVKLIDFGLADTDCHSYLKEPAGTPAYAAPEVLEGGSADCRSDIYSLGVIFSLMGGSRRLKRIADKCRNANPDKRYRNVVALQAALKHRPYVLLFAIAFILAVASTLIVARYNDRSDCSSADIDVIFEQATRLIEEAGSR